MIFTCMIFLQTPWEEVKKEMVEEKGLNQEAADHIGQYVKMNGGTKLVNQLKEDQDLMKNKSVKEALDDMQLLLKYLDLFDVSDKVCAVLSPILMQIQASAMNLQ